MLNLHGYFMSVATLVQEIEKQHPDFSYSHEINPVVEALIDNWPDEIIDQHARADWGWNPRFDLAQSVDQMLTLITPD